MNDNKIKADIVIANCSQLLTIPRESNDLGIIENGYLALADGRIACVGDREYVEERVLWGSKEEIDAEGKVVLPGFVDSHTHLVFGGSRVKEYALNLEGAEDSKYEALGVKRGIMATVEATRDMDEQELLIESINRLQDMLISGTTTVESKSGYGLTTSAEIKMLKVNNTLRELVPVDIVSTFLGAHGWPRDISKDRYIDMLKHEMIPWVAELGLARFCDIWCDDGHYTSSECEDILTAAKSVGLLPKIHTDAYSYIGGSDLAADMGMVSADHLNYTPIESIRKLKKADVVGVLLPGIDFSVRHPKPFNPLPMLEENMDIALATNCCPGCYMTSMQYIMRQACIGHGLPINQAIRAATLGGAKALMLEEDRGSLEVGKLADIQIWNTDTYEDVIYRIDSNMVEKVIKRGEVVIDRSNTRAILR